MICLVFLCNLIFTGKAQSQNQNQAPNPIATSPPILGRVVGNISIGSEEVTSIIDQATNCIYKTSAHRPNLYDPNQLLFIKTFDNGVTFKVEQMVQNTPDIVYAFPQCSGNPNNNNDDDFVTREAAEEIAKKMKFRADPNGTDPITKTIQEVYELPDDQNLTAFYIINYNEGGFVILAADKRSEPVLAFSERSKFDLHAESYPAGLVGWLRTSKESIEKLRFENPVKQAHVNFSWHELITGDGDVLGFFKRPEGVWRDPCFGTGYTNQYGPLLQTEWGQRCGYNTYTPDCDGFGVNCYHAPTGCVATAMAQVMKYHEHPSEFPWDDMPNTYGTEATALLMRAIGDAVNMNYHCDASSASEFRLVKALKDDFDYSNPSRTNYNGGNYQDYGVIKSEIRLFRPVIMSGGSKSSFLGFYINGHEWVCDGYRENVGVCGEVYAKFLHMNWGFDNDWNGWFSPDNFNPGPSTYNYMTNMIYNIKP